MQHPRDHPPRLRSTDPKNKSCDHRGLWARWAVRAAEPLASGQQLERVGVDGTNDREMTMVERRDLSDLQAFGQGDHGRVDGSERQIAVGPHELDDPRPVLRVDSHRFQCALGDIPEDVQLRVGADTPAHEVRDLREDENRHEERSGVAQQESQARFMVAVARVDGRDQRAGIDDEA